MKEMHPVEVKVWGQYALFTQPEMKVERMSYPCMTPSAARGILEAIFWKPEFWWEVREIQILKPIRFQSILRNEVSQVVPETIKGKYRSDYYADEDRTQRHSMVLYDVAYLIRAQIRLLEHATDDVAKYRDQFRRRVKKGQCFHRPYLGCREFAAYFAEPNGEEKPENLTQEVGTMLFDLQYGKTEKDPTIPHFFHARIENGTLHVPEEKYRLLGR
ncbi:type I-C CRISPR-associated protein Cas5c [Tumebacillus lipolyticus]|uniref:pre-crRNA processing endonuclease n=1 Tax=Tumebacillus lipolyticus TaxID=1280370 RepID=A0ABW4ZZY1_9BACL